MILGAARPKLSRSDFNLARHVLRKFLQ
uniref:Uncharacterized protein n=1 Tax=Rhizophora mucronata TaxID=61149 RepID=A0A2P2LXM0_RHIMU